MPRAPKACSTVRCPHTTTSGSRCMTCRRAADVKRGTPAQRGYGVEHQQRRAIVLKRDPNCVSCLAIGKREPTTVDDHIVPIECGGSIDNMKNHQGLCTRCHSIKRAAESRGKQMKVLDGFGLSIVGVLPPRKASA